MTRTRISSSHEKCAILIVRPVSVKVVGQQYCSQTEGRRNKSPAICDASMGCARLGRSIGQSAVSKPILSRATFEMLFIVVCCAQRRGHRLCSGKSYQYAKGCDTCRLECLRRAGCAEGSRTLRGAGASVSENKNP